MTIVLSSSSLTVSVERTLTEMPDDTTYTPKKPHTSFSQLDTYKRCSLQYYMKYVEGKRGRPALNLVRGKAGHAAVEADHRRKISTGTNMPIDEMLDKFSDSFDAEAYELEPSDLEPGDDLDKDKDATTETLRVYAAKTAPKLRPALVEWEFNLDLPATEEHEYPIKIVNGRIDLAEATGIFDNKFPKTRRTKSQDAVDQSWQLTLYDTVFSYQLGIEVANLGLISFLPPSQREPADISTVRRSAAEMEPAQRQRRRDRLIHVLRTSQRAIDAGIFMPADDPMVCSWCSFRTTCQSSLAKDDFAAIALRGKE